MAFKNWLFFSISICARCTLVSSTVVPRTALPSGELNASAYKYVVVIPDIHGDEESLMRSLWIALKDVEPGAPAFDEFKTAMELAIDGYLQQDPLSANPQDTVLVQLGDVLDRGPYGLGCLGILSVVSQVIGWKLVRLYGNHELMSHQGESGPYIHPKEAEFFAKAYGSKEARVTQFARGGALWKEISDESLLIARIKPSRPEEMDPTGLVPITSMSTLFVHGGIETVWVDRVRSTYSMSHPEVVSVVDLLNLATRDTVTMEQPPLPVDMLDELQSPLWIRDLAEQDPDFVCSELLPTVLKYFNVARIIVGHTPQKDMRMKSFCDSRIILADTSMSRWMRVDLFNDSGQDSVAGNPSALIMRRDESGALDSIKALYYDMMASLINESVFMESRYGIRQVKNSPNLFIRTPVFSLGHALLAEKQIYSTWVNLATTAQALVGSDRRRIIMALRHWIRSSEKRIYGVPEILTVGPLNQAEDFYIVLDSKGQSLATLTKSMVTLTPVRQILKIIKVMYDAGFFINYTRTSGQPERVLELFVLEESGMFVQLVDFSDVYQGCTKEELELMLAAVVADLQLINFGPLEPVPYPILVTEIFGSHAWIQVEEAMGSMSGVTDRYIPSPLGWGWYAVPEPEFQEAVRFQTISGSYDVSGSSSKGFGFDSDDFIEVVLDPPTAPDVPIEITWKIKNSRIESKTATSEVMRITLEHDSLLQVSETLMVHGVSAFESLEAMDTILSPDVAAFKGLLPLIYATARPDGSIYIAYKVMPDDLLSLTASIASNLREDERQVVADQIMEIIGELYKRNIMLIPPTYNPEIFISEVFFFSKVEPQVYLVDVSSVVKSKADKSIDFHMDLERKRVQMIVNGLLGVGPKPAAAKKINSGSDEELDAFPEDFDELFLIQDRRRQGGLGAPDHQNMKVAGTTTFAPAI